MISKNGYEILNCSYDFKFHNKLKLARKIVGLSQQELADLVGCRRNTICSIERGLYKPGIELALKLSRCLQFDVEYLFYISEY